MNALYLFLNFSMKKLFSILLLIVATWIFAQIPADFIFTNATIYTVNNKFNIAQAMAIKNGKIVGVGTQKSVLKKFKSSNIVSLENKYVYPGFIDAHRHFTWYAFAFSTCQL